MKNVLPTFLVGETRDQLHDLVGASCDHLRGDDVRGRVLLSWPGPVRSEDESPGWCRSEVGSSQSVVHS